jgi:hypothetical protein
MQFTLSVSCENDALYCDPATMTMTHDSACELARILRDIAAKLEIGAIAPDHLSHVIRDTNGNDIGDCGFTASSRDGAALDALRAVADSATHSVDGDRVYIPSTVLDDVEDAIAAEARK